MVFSERVKHSSQQAKQGYFYGWFGIVFTYGNYRKK